MSNCVGLRWKHCTIIIAHWFKRSTFIILRTWYYRCFHVAPKVFMSQTILLYFVVKIATKACSFWNESSSPTNVFQFYCANYNLVCRSLCLGVSMQFIAKMNFCFIIPCGLDYLFVKLDHPIESCYCSKACVLMHTCVHKWIFTCIKIICNKLVHKITLLVLLNLHQIPIHGPHFITCVL